MEIRRAGSKDADAVARLLCQFRDWFGKPEPSAAQVRSSVARIMAEGDGEYLLAEDGDPVGVCQLRYRWSVWTSSQDCWLEDLFVRERDRRAGAGKALVEAALQAARKRGCRRIELDVNERNEPALRLYEACGFSVESKGPGRSLFAGRALD